MYIFLAPQHVLLSVRSRLLKRACPRRSKRACQPGPLMASGHLPTSVGIYPEDLVFAARTEEIHWEHSERDDGYGRLLANPIFGHPNVGQSSLGQPVFGASKRGGGEGERGRGEEVFQTQCWKKWGSEAAWAPEGWVAHNFPLFSPLQPPFSFSLSLWVFFRGNLVGV